MGEGPRLLRGQVPLGRVGHRGGQRLLLGRGERSHGPIEECPERTRLLSGLTQGSKALPWDMSILRRAGAAGPVGDGWGGEAVCGKGAVEDLRRGGITSGTAKIPSAGGRCVAGRQPSGNASAGPRARDASGMPRRNVGVANSGRTRPPSRRKADPPRTRRRSPARGHAASGIRRFSAIAPAVMSPPEILLASQHRIVGTTAAGPCVRPETVNASG
jgi:hypothetical protein